MTVLLDRAEAAHREAHTKALEARKAYNETRDNVAKADVDLGPGSEAFAKLDELDRVRSTADEAYAESERHLTRVLQMEGRDVRSASQDLPQPPVMDPAEHKEGLRSLAQAAARITQGEPFNRVRQTLERSGKAGFGGNVNLGEAMSRDEVKAFITSGAGSGGVFITPDRKGYIDLPTRPSSILNWINVGTTDSNLIEYVRRLPRTNAAAIVADATSVTPGAEDGLKPQGTAGFVLDDEKVGTIAELIPVHRNTLADVPRMRSIIEGLLEDDLRLKLESAVYAGTDTIIGLTQTPGVNIVAHNTAFNVLEQIRRGMTQIRLNFREPNYIALHPADAERIAFIRTNSGGAGTGEYLAGSPFGSGITTLWGLPVLESVLITEGRPLVGNRTAASLWIREGAHVLASDSHKDWFQRNVIALLAELRAGFTVEVPSAFSVVAITA